MWDDADGYEAYVGRWSVANGEHLPLANESFDIVTSGLALNFMNASHAVAEQRRVTAIGGAVGGYVWDYAGSYELVRLFWDAASQVDPAAAGHDPGRRFELCHPAELAALFES